MRKTHYTKHLIHLLHLLVAMRFLFSFEKHNHGMKRLHNFPLLVSRFHPAWVQLDEIWWINPRLPLVDIHIIHSYKKFPLIVSFMSKREKAWGNGDKINITGYILKYSCAKKIKKSEVLYCFSGRFDPSYNVQIWQARWNWHFKACIKKYTEIWLFIHSTVMHVTST